jgi:hypothetical protein
MHERGPARALVLRGPFTLVAVVGPVGGAALGVVAMALRDLIGVDAVACDSASAIGRDSEKFREPGT